MNTDNTGLLQCGNPVMGTETFPIDISGNTTFTTWPNYDYRGEHIAKVRGWLEGFLDAKAGKLTKKDCERIIEELEKV